jgi:hypothetical protein
MADGRSTWRPRDRARRCCLAWAEELQGEEPRDAPFGKLMEL